MLFAPVISKYRENDYIINPKNGSAPYMILSFDTKNKRDDIISAIRQADFSACPQAIEKDVKDALWVFENSGLTYLQLGDYIVHKR